MNGRDDFENRLGQGLKRWAHAGEPTLDLEALVKERAGKGVVPLPKRRSRWRGWLGATAAAAALVLAAGATFPAWAGAAAGWPIVGPVVTEIIMKDAGMQWAYDNGLIRGTLAQAQVGNATFRILGVMADSRRTTVIYQVQGLPAKPADDGKPIRALGLSRPAFPQEEVDVFIGKVDGKGGFSSSSPGTETPLGLVGTVSTLPLESPTAELEVIFRYAGEEVTLQVTASRAETDRFSREVVVGESQEFDGVTVTLESVTYTPAETVVTYEVDSPSYNGSIQWDGDQDLPYLEVGGKKLRAIGGGSGVNNRFIEAYPPVEGPARLVFPVKVKGRAIEATWPLQDGAVTEVMGVSVTLATYERQGSVVAFQWTNPAHEAPFVGFAGFEVIDQNGEAHELGTAAAGWSSESNYVHEGVRNRRFSTELPEGVEPVAVRATRVAVLVKGPWVFELPR